MPCNYIRWVSIDFGEHTDFDLVEKAILKIGGKVAGRYAERITFSLGPSRSVVIDRQFRNVSISCASADDEQETIKRIKRGYAEQVVRKAARQKRWAVSEKRVGTKRLLRLAK